MIIRVRTTHTVSVVTEWETENGDDAAANHNLVVDTIFDNSNFTNVETVDFSVTDVANEETA